MPESRKILVIDDQIGVINSPSYQTFMDNYGDLDYEFVFASAMEGPNYFTLSSALGAIERHSDAALVVLDIKFGSESDRLGVDILSTAVSQYPTMPFIMMTSLEDEPTTVVKCMRLGARDYIIKGATPEDLAKIIEKYARRVTESHLILGSSPKIRDLQSLIVKVAQHSSISVLVVGERGTGKELVTRSIHYLGRRRNAPFVAANCAAFSKDLLAAELFGAEKGAYTGANQRKYGYIELANGGTLFLDEIGEAPLEVQSSLLRVLETKRFRRLGVSDKEITVDFQLLCATNADLPKLIDEGKFRPDLYDRIKGFEIQTPPLRDCEEDIELLAHHWLREIQESLGGISYHLEGFTPEVIERFRAYHWPGNVRELRNVVEAAMIRAHGPLIDLEDLPPSFSGQPVMRDNGIVLPPEGTNLNEKLAELELQYLSSAYETADHNKARTMQLFYTGSPTNYFDRIVYNAVQRAPDVLAKFPEFQESYDKEEARRRK